MRVNDQAVSFGEKAAAQSGGEYGAATAGAPWSATATQAAARAPIHRKRTGHLFSKMRYISAQLVGYLENGVWLDYAANANAQATALADGLTSLHGFSTLYPTQINMVHIEMPVGIMEAMQAEGFGIAPRRLRPGDETSGLRYCRLVTSWSTTSVDVAHFVARATALLQEEMATAPINMDE